MALIDLTKNKKGNRLSTSEVQATNEQMHATAKAEAAASASAPREPFHAAHDMGSVDELAKLREIVFGPQLRAFGEDVARLENRSALEATTLREELRAISRRLEDRITEMDARTTRVNNELRDQLLSQSNTLAEAIEESSQQAIDLLNKGLQEIRENKLDRSTLSSYLVDLASQIERDQKSPN